MLNPQFVLFGINSPEWLPMFDSRDNQRKFVYGRDLAEVSLGLRDGGENNSVVTTAIHGYVDLRDSRWKSEGEKFVNSLIKDALKAKAVYDSLGDSWDSMDTGKGGAGFYLPVGISVNNFGAALISDKRLYRVRFFQD